MLTQQVGKILGDRPHAMVATDVAGEHGVRRFLFALAELATLGVPVDPAPLFAGRATPLDLGALPLPAPGWTIDGAFVRTADGSIVANSLQPANTLPALDLGGLSPMGSGTDEAGAVVLEYLRGVRELVAAERDVMLRYLGGAVPTTTSFDDADLGAAIAATARPAPAATPGPPELVAQPEDRPVLSGAELLQAVQAIVSERTGYPIEMLDPDLDLEADLSIDSIKRIEIVGELAEKIGLAGLDEAAVDEELVEELAQHKSLRAIVDWIEAMAGGEVSPETEAAVEAAHVAHEPDHAGGALPPVAQRFEVRTQPLGPAVPLGDLAGASVGLVAAPGPLAEAVDAALARRGAVVVPFDLASSSTEREEALAALDGLVDLSSAGEEVADARSVFADLQAALLGRSRRVVAVTVPIHPDGQPTGVPGLLRALARERHDALVRSIEVGREDIDGAEVGRLAEAIVDELLDLDAPSAISWAGGERTTQVVGERADLAVPGDLDLGPDAVVVLTGGARGITARVAEGLARANPCHLHLVGRTPFPQADEDPRTAVAADRHALRRALLEIGELKTPHEIESACNRIEGEREMRETLRVLASFGAKATYHSIDVRTPSFRHLLAELRAEHGRLDGVIHGAGVLDDRFLRDKTQEGFDRVFATKVEGARHILDEDGLGLRFVVFFGSVSGVFGNKGQCDYAAANDALDALARQANGVDGRRVVSIDWGPWGGGGMVSPELEREYARRGIGLVDPADGVLALLGEIGRVEGPAQVVVMRGNPEAFAPPIEHTAASDDLIGRATSSD